DTECGQSLGFHWILSFKKKKYFVRVNKSLHSMNWRMPETIPFASLRRKTMRTRQTKANALRVFSKALAMCFSFYFVQRANYMQNELEVKETPVRISLESRFSTQ
ncbi:MAG TPA: hypothetical protein VN653_18670, partial [Anaerolineales bacterium]|nr:hypothetical protein [Anaerolineales bacterium]